MQLPRYFARLARYHAWATRKLLADDLAALSDEEWHRDLRLFFGSVHRTVNHLLVTDDIWHARFAEGRSPRIALDAQPHADRAPACAGFPRLATAADALRRHRHRPARLLRLHHRLRARRAALKRITGSCRQCSSRRWSAPAW